MVEFQHPQALWLALLALIPLLGHAHRRVRHANLAGVPADTASDWLERGLRATGVAAIVALVLGVAGLQRPAQSIERIGKGAQMVLLLDRSRSMDQSFAMPGSEKTVAAHVGEPKGAVARKLLADFVSRREDDLLGMVVFSTFPIPVLPLTQKRDIVQASISAGSIGRGLAETDIAGGIERAIRYFEDRAFEGSRLVMLVSDGAGQVDGPDRLRIAHLLRVHRVALYWIYIRAKNGPRIFERPEPGSEPSPERTLHEFFSAMPTPYKAYMAESPEDLQQAIADVGELQRLPVRYADATPSVDISHWCYRVAFALTLLLVVAKLFEVQRLRPFGKLVS